MEYLIIGPDGKEYGPANIDTVKQWVAENRIFPQTQLKNFASGQVLKASQIPGLFPDTLPAPAVAPPPGPFSQPPTAQPNNPFVTSVDGLERKELYGVILRCVGALIMFFVLHGFGVFFASYAVVYAIQAQQRGSRYGVISIVIAACTAIVLIVGWTLRLGGPGAQMLR